MIIGELSSSVVFSCLLCHILHGLKFFLFILLLFNFLSKDNIEYLKIDLMRRPVLTKITTTNLRHVYLQRFERNCERIILVFSRFVIYLQQIIARLTDFHKKRFRYQLQHASYDFAAVRCKLVTSFDSRRV